MVDLETQVEQHLDKLHWSAVHLAQCQWAEQQQEVHRQACQAWEVRQDLLMHLAPSLFRPACWQEVVTLYMYSLSVLG